ncbi:MAG TPA: glycosyltransferase family 2 protein [Opitutaceae bacterium]|nr:glycosyltransferase family 2 protein [Opitutaceae bacterium]
MFKVSFVIPLYNCLELTKACLESLQATIPRGLEHEIVLVDDGSTDGTREWLRSLSSPAVSLPAVSLSNPSNPSNGLATLKPPVRVLLNETNLGYAVSNNRGARAATGDILGLLNNDLVLLPGWLPPMLEIFRFGRRPGFVGNIQLNIKGGAVDHSGIFIDMNGKPAHCGPPAGIARFRRFRSVVAVTGACAFTRRDTFLQLGGFDEKFLNGGEDIDFCLRARAAGLRNWVALGSSVLHHISSSPGRREHDEKNSRRLAARWRAELVREGARTWCRRFFEETWPEPREMDPQLTMHALLAALHIAHKPPQQSLWIAERAMRAEELRWQEMFGPAGA